MGKIYHISRPDKLKRWVLDADIKGCFDNIDHEFLLKTIGNFPARKLIHLWLKAGVMEDGVFNDTKTGTPQGGIISPLLANIALHGMEEALTVYKTLKNGRTISTTDGVKYNNRGESVGDRQVVRYADDFLVFCKTKEDTEEVVHILSEWLKVRGLTLSNEKTQIARLEKGVNFLGFNTRLYKVSNSKTGWKLLIKPSPEKMQEIRSELRQKWLKLKGQSVKAIIKELNPYIRGIANYLRPLVSKKAFNSLDHYMYQREKRYANRMHPKRSTQWKRKRYWGRLNLDRQNNNVFGDKRTGIFLLKFSWFPIQRHPTIAGASSPDDKTLRGYWGDRLKRESKSIIPSHQKIASRQKFVCPTCGESLFKDEELEVHHIKPRSQGGKDNYSNLQLLHLLCHQQKHADRVHTQKDGK